MPELKNTIYIFIFDGRKRCTSCPKEGEGGGGGEIWAMPERKHLFLKEVFPNSEEKKRLVLYLFIANAGQEVCLYRVLMLVLWMFECN